MHFSYSTSWSWSRFHEAEKPKERTVLFLKEGTTYHNRQNLPELKVQAVSQWHTILSSKSGLGSKCWQCGEKMIIWLGCVAQKEVREKVEPWNWWETWPMSWFSWIDLGDKATCITVVIFSYILIAPAFVSYMPIHIEIHKHIEQEVRGWI